jgi:hypothetical protein
MSGPESLADIRAAIAAAVSGKGDPALHAYDYPPASLVTPCAVVEPEEVDFRAIQRGSETWTLSVFVLVVPVSAENATRQTDKFFDRSANDLKDAIEAVDIADIEVTGADRWGEYPVAGQMYQGFRLVCEVFN